MRRITTPLHAGRRERWLLVHDPMESDPAHVVRTIRRALGMSQAEFARVLGWGTSTISRWESGRGQPNRLALKIILAYGEERGVRYRGRTTTLPTPITVAHREADDVALPAVVVDRAPTATWVASAPTDRPGWEAQLSLRVAIDGRRRDGTKRSAWWAGSIAGGVVCTLLVGAIALLTATPATTRREARPSTRVARATTAETPPHAHPATPARARRARRRPASEPPIAAASPSATASAVAAPRTVVARLEGVTLLGATRTATFRTNVDSISVAEGEELAGRQAVRIGTDGVDLRDAGGNVQSVKLGDSVALE